MFNKEELTKIHTQLTLLGENNKKDLEEIKKFQEEKFKDLKLIFEEIKQKQVFYFDEYDKQLTQLNNTNLQFKKEFDNLNILKNNLSSKVLEKLEHDLKEELKIHFSKLGSEKSKFENLTKELELLKEEIRRLIALSEKIKSADLELTKHAQELNNRDDEKTRLLKRIDDLQTLVAKIRRGEHS